MTTVKVHFVGLRYTGVLISP